jgi:hypothetical protein
MSSRVTQAYRKDTHGHIDEKELLAHARRYMNSGVLPKHGIVLTARIVDALAHTSAGKVERWRCAAATTRSTGRGPMCHSVAGACQDASPEPGASIGWGIESSPAARRRPGAGKRGHVRSREWVTGVAPQRLVRLSDSPDCRDVAGAADGVAIR